MSKSHSDYLRDQEALPLRADKRDDYRVLHGFVTDAIDAAVHASGVLEYDEACALAERAFDLGRKVARNADKGPRPYHVRAAEQDKMIELLPGGFVIYGEKTVDKRLAEALHRGEEPEWALQRHADMLTSIESDQKEQDGNGAAIISKPPSEPCPHEVMDDDGGPPRRDWDDFPKVGFDTMAITRSVSGG